MSFEYCADANPIFFKMLDFSIAPPLLYYLYIPVVIFSLWLSFRTFFKNKKEPLAIYFTVLTLSLSLFTLNALLQWIAAPVWLVNISWQSWGFFYCLFSLSVFVFIYNMVYGKELHKYVRYTFYFLLIPLIISIPFGMKQDFNYDECEGVVSLPMMIYTFSYQLLIIGSIFYVFVKSIIKPDNFIIKPKKLKLVLISTLVLLFSFFITLAVSEAVDNYLIELIGPFGSIIFITGISISIFDNEKLNKNILGAEALVVVLFIIMGGILLINNIGYIYKITYFSLFLVLIIGSYLIKSVKREVEQRIQIEQLATRLREVNKILSHDVKGALGKHAMLFKSLSQGDFGPVTDQAKNFIEQSAKDALKLIDSIMVILQSGHELVFHPTKFNLGGLVKEVVDASQEEAKKKNLELTISVENIESLDVELDQAYIKMHVIQNLVSNAINYTLTGRIDVNVKKSVNGNLLFSVKDTGVGVSKEDAPRLFKEAGHGAHSTEINVHSTGYGLYSAKRVVEACGGRIWFESEGVPGKGTTFFVELPYHITTTAELKSN